MVALAELYLPSDPEDALDCSYLAMNKGLGSTWLVSERTRLASATLIHARALLALGRRREAEDHLASLARNAIPSPREFSLACRVIAAFRTDPVTPVGDQGGRSRAALNNLKAYLDHINASYEGHDSTICFSGLGAARFVRSDFRGAAQDLDRARDARNDWPEETQERHWADDACDLYLLAMAHRELARIEGDPVSRRSALDSYNQAEAMYQQRGRPAEGGDILLMLRDRARELLEIR